MPDYDIGKAFARIEKELMTSMIRNMERHKAEEIEEGYQWSQWQVEQLRALEEYRKRNKKKFPKRFQEINGWIPQLVSEARADGQMDQEADILEAISKGFKAKKGSGDITGAFFEVNDRKLNALIEATTNDFERAEVAILRRAEDQYRQVIFDAQVYANAGGTTYEKAVDMATKDFISKGIDCIEYANGARHTLSDYADMAIRTAVKRAYLIGEGEKRQEWGIATVIVNKRGNPCPKCAPFCGKVLIDDVWSGGSRKDGPYPLMSLAVEHGLYHPRCRDSHTTYFPGISTADDKWSKEELEKIGANYEADQRQQYAKRQADKYERLADTRLDPGNKRQCEARAERWQREADKRRQRANISDDPFERMFYDRQAQNMDDLFHIRGVQNAFRGSRFRNGGPIKAITDVTQEFVNDATPGIGNLLIDTETELNDQDTTRWLHKMFGGDIHCLKEDSKTGKMPDALWRNRYWEYKAPTTKNAIDDRMRKGNKQLLEALIREERQDDERGLVIDIVGMTIDKQEAVLEIQKRAIQRCKGPTTVIIKDGNRFVKAFRIG